MKRGTLVIGIDQSYKNTGISLCYNAKIQNVTSLRLSEYNNNSERRKALESKLEHILGRYKNKVENVVCVIERIRLRSQGFLNIEYIKSIGALNSVIIDICYKYGVEVYSVDTRCWKSQVIGTSKGKSNKFGVPEEKWPTVKWVISQGFRDNILVEINTRKTKGTFLSKDGKRYQYNDDAADSAGISMFWFVGELDKLHLEK